MREILFRGKNWVTGKWVEGAYYKVVEFYGKPYEQHLIITSSEALEYDQALEYERVDPATVGQYTGLKDMNKNRIFEGDVVVLKKVGGVYIPPELQFRGLVMFERGRFCIVTQDLERYDLWHYAPDVEIVVAENGKENSELIGGDEP